MKITKLIIENFRCYYGRQEIDFNTDGKITLIYGLSGAGKTSFLQCISWILYGKNDFLNDHKNTVQNYQLYNIHAFEEASPGSTISVKGTLDFTHNDTDYVFIREANFQKNNTFARSLGTQYKLLISNDGNWTEYTDDVNSKINEIVPLALSKYFFFHGEKMDLLNTEDSDLNKAIYNLFGINKFEEASKDLGDKSRPHTVISKYYSELNKNIKESGNVDPSSAFRDMQNCKGLLEKYDEDLKSCEKKIAFFTTKTNDLLEQITLAKSSDDFKKSIKNNKEHIEELEYGISEEKKNISRILYSSVPYLLLRNTTKRSVRILEEEVNNVNQTRTTYFNHLTKELLKEIKEKHTCICGRVIDEETEKYIQDTIDMMPPDSYTYQLKQFVQKSTDFTNYSEIIYDDYDNSISKISTKINNIRELDEQNISLTEKMKGSDDTKNLARDFEIANKSLVQNKALKDKINRDKLTASNNLTILENKYEKIKSISTINARLKEKIEILEALKRNIDILKNKKISNTREILEQSIVDVYKIFSTRTEDFTKTKFLNDDFSLRKVTRTGGQEAIDVYSYIIGMIKALHSVEDENTNGEFPIIIDAPFSHTDVIQASSVFETLPTIAQQVIILSLEIDKFRNAIKDNVGYTYVITSNDRQTRTTINRCSIDELFEIEKENSLRAVKGE